MSRFKAAKKLDAIDARLLALEAERRRLEQQLFDQEVGENERRERYLALADAGQRRQLMGLQREIHEMRGKQSAAAVKYWGTVVTETHRKLDDLRDTSPRSAWRRGVWYDILTILWILVGGGFWAFSWAGAIAGAVFTAAWAPFLARGRERTRISSIRKGEEILRSAANELRLAEHATETQASGPPFSAAEALSGNPDSR